MAETAFRTIRLMPLLFPLVLLGCKKGIDDDTLLDVPEASVPVSWVRVQLPKLGMSFCVPEKLRTIQMPDNAPRKGQDTDMHSYVDLGPPEVEVQVRTIDATARMRPNRQLIEKMVSYLPQLQPVKLVGKLQIEQGPTGTRFVQECSRDGKQGFFVFWMRPTRIYSAVFMGSAATFQTFVDSVRLTNPDPDATNKEPGMFPITTGNEPPVYTPPPAFDPYETPPANPSQG
ncbi:hypothetical protein EON81_14145, partial [bacterium]